MAPELPGLLCCYGCGGQTTYKSQPCNQGRKSDNQKGSKRQEGHISDRKAKGYRFK